MAASSNYEKTQFKVYDTTKCIELDKDRTLLIGGNSACGKSVICYDLVTRKLKENPDRWAGGIYFLAPTGLMQRTFRFLPREWIYTDPTKFIEIISDIMEYQKEKCEKYGGPERVPSILIIMDDCLGSFKATDRLFTSFVTTGRHYKISLIVLTQHLKCPLTGPAMRENIITGIFGITSDSSEDVVIGFLRGTSKREKKRYLEKVWSEPFMFVVTNNAPRPKYGRQHLLQINSKKLIPFAQMRIED
jgi:hypothetical protein